MVPWWTLIVAYAIGQIMGVGAMAICRAGDDNTKKDKKESADVPAPTDQ